MTAGGKPTAAELGIDPAALPWERSGEGDGAIEVAFPEGGWTRGDWVLMRVAGDPGGRILVYDRNEWACFLDGARRGEFDDAVLAGAGTVRCCSPLLVPGPLRTPAYTQALLRAAGLPPLPDAGGGQQPGPDGPSDGPGAPRISVVLTEAALLFRWGSRGDRRGQVEHLAAMSRKDSIELRLQQLCDGPPAAGSAYTIVTIPGSGPFVVTGAGTSSRPGTVDGYIRSFEQARLAALEPGDTTVFLENLAKRME